MQATQAILPTLRAELMTSRLLVLDKIIQILDTFSLSHPTRTLSEIQRQTNLATSTVQRLVGNLVEAKLLVRDGDSLRIGTKMAVWGGLSQQALPALDEVQVILDEIRDRTDETACFFREEQGLRVCVAVAETSQAIRREMYVGKLVPLHIGSAGRVIMAWRPQLLKTVLASPVTQFTDATVTDPDEIRRLVERARLDGYAISANEREAGVSGISVPVFGPGIALTGVLQIIGPEYRISREKYESWAPDLLEQARSLTAALGGQFLPDLKP